ncbi:hypothetical protein [Pseudovibrio exalbescens]|uniref:hypothetical protein n=1 Tax=Pseudovibrio exalbescens TaxID=197461 RepID=UPI000C999D74|nr:hypothetical protein [Pseudovibrio exalbescens]
MRTIGGAGQHHQVFFDEGLFPSKRSAEDLAGAIEALSLCEFHFEQDSQKLRGIQLADIVAHKCGIMLLHALGYNKKTVIVDEPNDSAYDGLEIDLGFEMWAGMRYAFLFENKPNPKDDFELATVDVFPWGVFIDSNVYRLSASAAMERFGEIYLGCIH